MLSEDERSTGNDQVHAQPVRPLRGRQHLLLWASWMLACAGAGVAARTTGQFMSYLSLGFAFGVAQAMVLGRLRHRAPVDPRLLWVAVSTIGGVVAFGLGLGAAALLAAAVMGGGRVGLLGESVATGTLWVVLWTVIGAAQWLVFRLLVPRAGRWVRASATGGVAFVAAEVVIRLVVGGSAADAAPYGAVTGACYGAVTGVVLVRLFPGREGHAASLTGSHPARRGRAAGHPCDGDPRRV